MNPGHLRMVRARLADRRERALQRHRDWMTVATFVAAAAIGACWLLAACGFHRDVEPYYCEIRTTDSPKGTDVGPTGLPWCPQLTIGIQTETFEDAGEDE